MGGDTYTVTATATSGLAPVLSIALASASVCSISGSTSGSTVSFTGAGTCTIEANQAGDPDWNPADQDTQAFAVAAYGSTPQTIEFDLSLLPAKTYGDAPFDISATATGGGSGNPVVFASRTTGVCTVSGTNGTTVTIVAAGTCTIRATQDGNATYAPADPVDQSFLVAKASQTVSITTTAPTSAVVGGDTYTVTATATSGLAPVLSIALASASVCSISGSTSGSTVSFTGAGTCTIEANQAGDPDWNPADQDTQAFAVAAYGSTPQTIEFDLSLLPAKTYGDAPFDISATATGGGSGNPVVFASRTTGVCTVSGTNGTTVTIVAAGTCTIRATQDGNATYAPADPVDQSFTIAKAAQTALSVTGPSSATYGAPDAAITTSGGSGTGGVTFSAGTSTACSIVAGKLHVTSGTGTCTVTATRAADNDYAATTSLPFAVTIAKAAQTALSVTGPSSATYGAPDAAITTSGGSGTGGVTFSAGTSTACSIVAGKLHVTSGTGTCTVTATRAADNDYAATTSLPFAVTIAKAAQTALSVTGPSSATYGAPDAAITTSGGSGTGGVTFSAGTSTACSIVAGKLHVTSGTGTCTVTATRAADNDYAATTSLPFAVTIAKAAQTITFTPGAPASAFVGQSYTVKATATSGLVVAFTPATASICSVSGSTVTFLKVGTCTINANQAGDANWRAATQGQQAVPVLNRAPTCTSVAASVVMNVVKTGSAGCIDHEHDAMTYAIVAAAAHGKASVDAAGTWTYTPALNYRGADSFTLKANDGNLGSIAATITITVSNLPLDARNDSVPFVRPLDATVIKVLANDSPGVGETGQPLTITAVSNGSKGRVTTDGATVSYDPNGCSTGVDTFTYTVTDGQYSATKTVFLTIARPGQNGLSSNPVTDIPALGFITNSTIGSTVPAKLNWCGITRSGYSVHSYTVGQSTNGGTSYASKPIISSTATSSTRNLSLSTTYRWRARTIDSAHRTGSYRYSLTSRISRYQETSTAIAWAGSWGKSTSGSPSGGAEKYTTARGASATIYLSNVRQFAVVGPRSTTRGSFEVWVDGSKVATISEHASSTVYRRVLYVRSLTSGAGVTHRIEIRAVGNGRIDLDAILSLS